MCVSATRRQSVLISEHSDISHCVYIWGTRGALGRRINPEALLVLIILPNVPRVPKSRDSGKYHLIP